MGHNDDNSRSGITRTKLDDVTGTTNRRGFLRATAGATALAAGISAAGLAAANDDYDTVLDIVEDLGADSTGEEPINDALAVAVADVEYDIGGLGDIEDIEYEDGDSVMVVFPPGDYLVENGPGGDGFARWAFGSGDEQKFLGKLALVGGDGVTLRTTAGGRYTALTLWGRELHIEGFRLDQTPHDTSTGLTTVARDHLLVRDVHLDGKVTGDYVETPHWQSPDYDPSVIPHDPTCIIPGLLSEDGEGLIENFRVPDGVESRSRKGGCWVNFLHAGDLLFRNCEFSYLSDNAIYGSPPGIPGRGNGSVRVENSVFKNNNVTAIRLGTPGSYAKDCTVVTEAGEIPATPWGAITSRAGWVWYNFDGFYENVEVVHNHPSGHGILDHGDSTRNVNLEVRDCHFELNNDGATAIRFVHDGVEQLTVEDLHVTGEGGGGTALSLGNCEIDGNHLCLHQTGANRNGISLDNVTGTISNSVIDVTGEQFVASGTTDVWALNLHDEGPCPPDGTGRDEHIVGDEAPPVETNFRLSDVRMRDEVHFDPDGYVIGRATVTNHGDETATTQVGVWLDFFEDFLAGDRSYEVVTLDPGESTGVVFYLDDDSSSPGSHYQGVKLSTLSDEHEFDIIVHHPPEPDDDHEGCGPGFWRNTAGTAWSDADVFSPDFVVDGPFVLAAEAADDASNQPLVDVLAGDGGPDLAGAQRILLRAAVAGLLNAQHANVNYALSEIEVIDGVTDALATGDRETILDLAEELDAHNNVACPLDASA